MPGNQEHQFICGDSRRLPLADGSVHACVTSPPYFALRKYGGDAREIGRETTPAEYVSTLVEIFREVRRVLRPDGTLWLNIGETWNAYNGNRGKSKSIQAASDGSLPKVPGGGGLTATAFKAKDCIGIPWMVASALRDDGWYWRHTVIWEKASPMPGSYKDRPTLSWEPVFLFSKSPRYAYDWFAGTELAKHDEATGLGPGWAVRRQGRDVWRLPHTPVSLAHFAVMSRHLAARCIKLSCPEGGCCAKCGKPRERIVHRERFATRSGETTNTAGRTADEIGNRDTRRHVTAYKNGGFEFACQCGQGDVSPCVVLDPFGGVGTTASAANILGRSSVSIDLYPENCELARNRVDADWKKHQASHRYEMKRDPWGPQFESLPGQSNFFE